MRRSRPMHLKTRFCPFMQMVNFPRMTAGKFEPQGGDLTIGSATGLLVTGAYTPVLTVSHDGNVVVAGDLTLNSDARLKTDIAPMSRVLEEVCLLEPVSYLWREDLERIPSGISG